MIEGEVVAVSEVEAESEIVGEAELLMVGEPDGDDVPPKPT